ncbi:putative wall-associated receptor kinase, galacturonan-binding domain-containing protein [Rosa chinensis]|uniref:Putative wall-associated receptor kinase, galacturonan-binding domain-containing protein n=1 Tax=Rosa chinensis TaxID=74649 RepID=A0A2P6S0N6_ROSCH|nr:wall-associated receptor kinase-like 8 [Rosa chinensis]PRQ52206.1 putative wall-associated receptor kinase, galacturonan-binding domain-containing protein [Rosa chinensis]
MAVILLQLLVRITLLLTFWSISTMATSSSSELAWPIAKPNCETHCGNISIPYPFGIGPNKDCYFDEWFEIECANNSTGPHKPFLKHTQPKLEVLNISMEGTLLVNNPATFFYEGNRTRQLAPNLTEGPFIYSQTYAYNRFTAMSCGFSELVRSDYDERVLGGCFSACNTDSSSIYNYGYDCIDGINCCQATLPPYLTLITTKIQYSETDEELLTYYNYAFLAEQTWFQNKNFKNTTMELKNAWFEQNISKFKAIEASMGMFPVVLDWSIRLYDTSSYFAIFKGFIGSHSSYNDSRP